MRRCDLDWPTVFAAALDASARSTLNAGTRSLDLLHVAAARALGCTEFVSAADRQLRAAHEAGLVVIDLRHEG